MQITTRLFTVFLTIQGILYLLLGINNSITPLGKLLPWTVVLLFFSSPALITLSAIVLLKKSGLVYKIAAIIGIATALLGIAMIVSLFMVYIKFV